MHVTLPEQWTFNTIDNRFSISRLDEPLRPRGLRWVQWYLSFQFYFLFSFKPYLYRYKVSAHALPIRRSVRPSLIDDFHVTRRPPRCMWRYHWINNGIGHIYRLVQSLDYLRHKYSSLEWNWTSCITLDARFICITDL